MENIYLEKLLTESVPVAIYLINGIKLSGIIAKIDEKSLILKDSKSTVEQLIYKHAISTITAHPIQR